jgi:WhiB family redox-sensing transcriptional regulator
MTVLFDVRRPWWPQHACREEDFGLFFADGSMANRPPGAGTQAKWDQAKEICQGCPVLAQCRRDTLGEEYGVYGGLDQYERYIARRVLAKQARGWTSAQRLEWGKALLTLRDRGLSLREIMTQSGVLPSLATKLLEEAEKDRETTARAKAAGVVDLALPEIPARGPRPFPERPGRRHAWVRRGAVISDAFYRAQTPDGAFFYMKTKTSRGGETHTWVRAEHVHIYHPQPVVILNYRERPDRDDRAA